MSSKEQFTAEMQKGYVTKGGALEIGAAIYEAVVIPEAVIRIPLKTLNRHGLIAGATGTGKTKTLQVLAEEMSKHGIPTLMMDIKGDLSGLAMPGTANEKIDQRHAAIGLPWKAEGVPVELYTLTDAPGVRLRATVSEFGPVLFSKILDLNDTQSGVVSLIFKIADDRQWPILDLKDFRKVLQYLTNEGKEEIRQDYGAIATSTASTIIRKIVEIEEQGADLFFGEPSFDVEDLLQLDEKGRAYSGILRLSDIQDRPKLFSTFMLSLLAEIYARFPETGDTEQPRLVIFIDEAHLIFKEASDALLDQIETIVKLIRSKGVGIIFCTQSPTDIPAIVLSQLGLKIQHALRAFTANDRKAIKQAAGNYPESDFYVPDQVITQLGTGEALITALSEKGNPTPLAVVMMRAPGSRMDILNTQEIDNFVSSSRLNNKYNAIIDRESAYELLREKISGEGENKPEHKQKKEAKKDESVIGEIIGSTTGRQVARTIAREVTRSLLGVLGIGTRRRR